MSLNDQGRTKEAWNLLARVPEMSMPILREIIWILRRTVAVHLVYLKIVKSILIHMHALHLLRMVVFLACHKSDQSYRELTESTPIPEIFPFVFNIIGLHPSRIDESHPPVPFIDDAYPSTFNAFPQNSPSNPPGTTTFLR